MFRTSGSIFCLFSNSGRLYNAGHGVSYVKHKPGNISQVCRPLDDVQLRYYSIANEQNYNLSIFACIYNLSSFNTGSWQPTYSGFESELNGSPTVVKLM